MENFKQNIEKTPDKKVLEFENLDLGQAQVLKDAIQNNKGLVRVFIHADWYTDEYENRIKDPMIRLLKSQKSPPVFFFEDLRHIDSVKKVVEYFNEVANFPNPVYLVKTMQHLPFPVMEGVPLPDPGAPDSFASNENLIYGHKSLGRFLFQLHALGVRKILVGGNELIIDEGGDINKCVGNFVGVIDTLNQMAEKYPDFPKIDVKVSEMTGPKNRSDLRGIRNDLL